MTVKDVMTLLESPDRVRVIKDGEEIYNQYFANMEVDKDIVAQIGDAEVKRFRAIPEITHRKYKERGLIAPMKPEETPDYCLMGYSDEDFDRAKAVQERNGKYYKALYDQAGNSIAVPIFESIFRKIILQEVA